jgi:hypothetical protein
VDYYEKIQWVGLDPAGRSIGRADSLPRHRRGATEYRRWDVRIGDSERPLKRPDSSLPGCQKRILNGKCDLGNRKP